MENDRIVGLGSAIVGCHVNADLGLITSTFKTKNLFSGLLYFYLYLKGFQIPVFYLNYAKQKKTKKYMLSTTATSISACFNAFYPFLHIFNKIFSTNGH